MPRSKNISSPDPQADTPPVESLTGGKPLQAINATQLSGDEAAAVDRDVALYEAAARGDTAEFERLRDGGAK